MSVPGPILASLYRFMPALKVQKAGAEKKAKEILDEAKALAEKIGGFEVIQGNMDDVFLNVTGLSKEVI